MLSIQKDFFNMQMVYNSTKRNDSTLKQNSKQKENHKDDGKQVYLLKLVLCFCYFASTLRSMATNI